MQQLDSDLGSVQQRQCSFSVDEVILFESRRENGRVVYVPLFTNKLKP